MNESPYLEKGAHHFPLSDSDRGKWRAPFSRKGLEGVGRPRRAILSVKEVDKSTGHEGTKSS